MPLPQFIAALALAGAAAGPLPPYCPGSAAKAPPSSGGDAAAARRAVERVARRAAEDLGPGGVAELDALARGARPVALGTLGTLLAAGGSTAGSWLLAHAALAAPADGRAFSNLGAFLALERGREAEAVALLERAATLRPRDPAPMVNLGIVDLRAGRLDAARRRFEAARRLAPGLDEPVVGLAAVAACRRDADQARHLLAGVSSPRGKAMADQVLPPSGGGPGGAPGKPGSAPAPGAAPESARAAADRAIGERLARETTSVPPPEEDQGHGRTPRVDGPPTFESAKDAVASLERLERYTGEVAELSERERRRSGGFTPREYRGGRIFVVRDWTSRRWAVFNLAQATLSRRMAEIDAQEKERDRQIGDALRGEKPSETERNDRIGRCGYDSACANQVRRDHCKARRAAAEHEWSLRSAALKSFTDARYAAAHGFYAQVTDGAWHWVDRRNYQRAIAWASSEAWGVAEGAGTRLLGLVQGIDPVVLTDDPYCGEQADLGPLAPLPSPKADLTARDWCPDALQMTFSVPQFGYVAAGCGEVGIGVQLRLVEASAKYSPRKGSFTLGVSAGGETEIAGVGLGAKIAAEVTFSHGFPSDVRATGEVKLGEVLQATAEANLEGEYEVKATAPGFEFSLRGQGGGESQLTTTVLGNPIQP